MRWDGMSQMTCKESTRSGPIELLQYDAMRQWRAHSRTLGRPYEK